MHPSPADEQRKNQLRYVPRMALAGCGKSSLFCHSERSEESLFDLAHEKKEGFFASLRMTKVWMVFFADC
jgi:hypothetical protein